MIAFLFDCVMAKRVICVILFIGFCLNLNAKVRAIVHYNFGKSGNVTYSVAPERLEPQVGGEILRAIGKPVFYADAPGNRRLNGEGCVLFNGKNDGYQLDRAIGNAKDNQILEVWVKARTQDTSGKEQVLLAHGSRKKGYLIIQKNDRWILVSGGNGGTEIGKVTKDVWTHLALVIEDGEGSAWMNGKQTASFHLTKELADNFSLAISDQRSDFFYGEIYEVRYSTFQSGDFNSDLDFLLDYERVKESSKIRKRKKDALIAQLKQNGLGKELVSSFVDIRQSKDWLVQKVEDSCRLQVLNSKEDKSILFRIENGLISRTFYLGDNVACVSYKNMSNEAEYLRAVKPEARILIDSTWYDVGGLKKQPEYSYLLESWYPLLEASPQAFTLTNIETSLPLMRYPWKQKYNAVATDWPTKGLRVIMTFEPTNQMPLVKDIVVKVNYEIYQGIPVIAKWIEVINNGKDSVVLNAIETEIIAVNQDQVNNIHVESDYSFALVNADIKGSVLLHLGKEEQSYLSSSTSRWIVDEEYNTWATQNAMEDKFLGYPHRNLLVSTLPMGPNIKLKNDIPFKSFLTFELLQDCSDKERQSLGVRRMYKKLAPQVTESLIGGGITSHDKIELKKFIEQMSDLGLEQLEIHPWPGISHDNLDSMYVQHWHEIAEYAKERGIIMGGYELQVASRGRGENVDCIDPETGKPGSMFGQSVCIASEWSDYYYSKMWEFFDKTGFLTYSIDGPYHGDLCASTKHRYHRGLKDSQWEQWKMQVNIIHELQRRNMYIPLPDWYFWNGQCSTGMGYREASANLSPQQQMLLGRQYIYDGTWYKLPTMGAMTLQLVGFYTNDSSVGLEPLYENLDHYEQQLFQYLASGCKLTIRGNRLYDTPQTRQMVKKWISWFKQYRDILTSDIIHVERPTGRDLDCILHVNPFIKHKGMIAVFNPTDREIFKKMYIPLYYTGLQGKATLISESGEKQIVELSQNGDLCLPISLKAQGIVWFLIEE